MFRSSVLLMKDSKLCLLTNKHPHHVPLCTYVGPRPKDDEQSNVMSQLKEILHIPVSPEVVATWRLLVVVPGNVP